MNIFLAAAFTICLSIVTIYSMAWLRTLSRDLTEQFHLPEHCWLAMAAATSAMNFLTSILMTVFIGKCGAPIVEAGNTIMLVCFAGHFCAATLVSSLLPRQCLTER